MIIVGASLVAWMLTLFLVYTDGPPLPRLGPVFLWLREKAGILPGIYVDGEWVALKELGGATGIRKEDVLYQHNDEWFALLLSCHRCVGFWIGLIVGVLVLGLDFAALIVPAAAIFLQELLQVLER